MYASEPQPNDGGQERVAVVVQSPRLTSRVRRLGFCRGTSSKVETREQLLKKYNAASDHDAPPESGNFDCGFAASAGQAARYARDARQKREEQQ